MARPAEQDPQAAAPSGARVRTSAPRNGDTVTAPGRATPVDVEEFDDITLLDIVRVLYRRRIIIGTTLLLVLVAAGAATVMTPPTFESTAHVIPLEHGTIIATWLGSQQAAEIAAAQVGDRVAAALFPSAWDATADAWLPGAEPSAAQVGAALRGRINVDGPAGSSGTIAIRASFGEPEHAHSVASAVLGSLDGLRPQLENLTRSRLFDSYYDGTNAQEAQRRAETASKEKQYWLVFDGASLPSSPVSPRPALNMVAALVFGTVLGVLLALGREWLTQFRSDFARVERPPD